MPDPFQLLMGNVVHDSVASESAREAARRLEDNAQRYTVMALAASARAVERNLLLWRAEPVPNAKQIKALLRGGSHFRCMGLLTPPAVFTAFFQRRVPPSATFQSKVCRRFAAQAEQWEAMARVTRPKHARRVKEARSRYWKLTTFLTYLLLPSLLVVGRREIGGALVREWARNVARDPALFHKGPYLMAPSLYTSVALSASLCAVGSPQVIFTRNGGIPA